MRTFYGMAAKTLTPVRRAAGRQFCRFPVAFPGGSRPFDGAGIGKGPGPAPFLRRPAKFIKEVPRMAKAGNRVKVVLRCSECKQRNYNTKKNKRNTTERLELNKYCPFCRKHTLHTETK